MEGYDTSKILNLIKKVKPELWNSFLRTANRSDTETIVKKEEMITLVEYYYGKSKFHLCAPLSTKFCIHPVYQYAQAIDLKTDIEPLMNMSINELKKEILTTTPKFLRTIRSNKAPIILDAEYGMKADPYRSMNTNLIKHRAKIIRENERFSENILTVLREIAEEKEQSKSQETLFAEESIYQKFTSNKDTSLFGAWHSAPFKEKLRLLDKFDD